MQRCCYFWKETLPGAGESNPVSCLGPVSLPSSTGQQCQWASSVYHTLIYALFIWQQPYEGNMIIIPFYRWGTWRDYLLKVTEQLGKRVGGRHMKKSGSAVQTLSLPTFTLFDTLLLNPPLSSFPPTNAQVLLTPALEAKQLMSWSGETPARSQPSWTFLSYKDSTDQQQAVKWAGRVHRLGPSRLPTPETSPTFLSALVTRPAWTAVFFMGSQHNSCKQGYLPSSPLWSGNELLIVISFAIPLSSDRIELVRSSILNIILFWMSALYQKYAKYYKVYQYEWFISPSLLWDALPLFPTRSTISDWISENEERHCTLGSLGNSWGLWIKTLNAPWVLC